MSAQTTRWPKLDETAFDPDAVNHWMKKADITRGIIEGTPAKALCGTVFTPSSHGGSASNEKSMVCPLCQLAYESLRN